MREGLVQKEGIACVVPPAPPIGLLAGASLFLDFDGTLVAIAERPDAVRVGPVLPTLLASAAQRLGTRLALISGRPAAEVHRLLGALDVPIVGSHGMEFRQIGGQIEAPVRPPALDAIRHCLAEFVADRAGLLIEEKPLGIALHYRMAPSLGAEVLALARSLADQHGLALQTGKMMVELRAAGGDKGTAIAVLMRDPARAGTHPLFLGDDDTDEAGFAAAAALGGAGVLVGPPRPSAARWRLPDVAAVHGWLAAALEALA